MNEKDFAMKKTLFATLPLALGAGLMVATPASAANWQNANSVRAEIRQLDRQIDRARGLSNRQEARLDRRVNSLRSLYRQYKRGGINRAERRTLNKRLASLKYSIRVQSRSGHRR